MAGEARFETLDIIRPSLDVRRDAAGKLFVAGIALEGPKGGAPNDWVLRQRQIVIREGQVRWTDQQRGAPALALENVNLVLLNSWNRHRFALHATPPASLAQPIDVRADFTNPRFAASRADVRLWKGELYADLRDTDLAGWKAYIDYPFQLTQGKGSVRAWLSLDHAKLAGFTADVALSGVSARLGKDLPPLDLARATGRVSAREHFPAGVEDGTPTFGTHGHSVTLDNFSVVTVDGRTLPPTTLAESFTPAGNGKPEKVHRQRPRARPGDAGRTGRAAAADAVAARHAGRLRPARPADRLLGRMGRRLASHFDLPRQGQGRPPRPARPAGPCGPAENGR